MDRSKLSSNWKQLQKTLPQKKQNYDFPKPDPPTSAWRKRKYARLERDWKSKSTADTGKDAATQRPEKKFKPAVWKAERKQSKSQQTGQSSALKMAALPTPATEELSNPSDAATPEPPSNTQPAPPAITPPSLGKYISLDTEMIGTPHPTAHSLPPHGISTNGKRNDHSILARVSLVTHSLETVYDAYVLPPPNTPISSYRTRHSGITPWHLKPGNKVTNPKRFEEVQAEVARLLDGRVLVGHALAGDLKVLGLTHPRARIRDTSRHPKYRTLYASGTLPPAPVSADDNTLTRTAGPEAQVSGNKGRTPSLKLLASMVLGWDIQGDVVQGHSSVEDARAAMALFKAERVGFEEEARKLFGRAAVATVSGSEKGKPGSGHQMKAGTSYSGGLREDLVKDEDAEHTSDDDANLVNENQALDAVSDEEVVPASIAAIGAGTKRTKRKTKKKKGKYR